MANDKPKSTLRKSDYSLCKRSTRIAVNIIKLSSLCLARISLLPLDVVGKQRRRGAGPSTDVKPCEGEGIGRSSWEARSSPASYLREPPAYEEKKPRAGGVMMEGDGSNVNERAEDYISKIRRRRNLHDLAADGADAAAKVIPPPPPRRPSLPYGRGS